LSPTATGARAYRRWPPAVPQERRDADLQASQAVAAQDLDICERVQRGYTAGIDTRGRLVLPHEDGVRHVHELLRAALS